jgi:hypothetical protein
VIHGVGWAFYLWNDYPYVSLNPYYIHEGYAIDKVCISLVNDLIYLEFVIKLYDVIK